MNYSKIYKQLIDCKKSRGVYKKDLEFYTEKHHIVPKSLGGSDGPYNLVLLTPREHYVAHLLLRKIYPDSIEMKYALILMSDWGKVKTSKSFELLRTEISELMVGDKNHFYGKTHTAENREKMGAARRGKKMSRESIERTRKANQGAKRSPQALINMSKAALAKKLRPWETSANKFKPEREQFWALSDFYYNLWKDNGEFGPRRFAKLYNEFYCDDFHHAKFNNLIALFRKGWIPSADSEWLSFKEEYGG